MIKRLIFPSLNVHGEPIVHLIALEGSFVKTASGILMPELRNKIKTLEKKAGRAYLLVNALGASEYYGDNINGDRFIEKLSNGQNSLINDDPGTYGFKTFEKYAKVYKHHVNKDPDKRYGDVLYSAYNPGMHRVELLLDIDMDKTADILTKVEHGDSVDLSMGCKVPSDFCTYCDHESKTTHDYCEHLKYKMGEILDDGTKIAALNKYPKFFDISFVFIGADPTAKVMAKIASENGLPPELCLPSAVLADLLGEKDPEEKSAQITKQIPAGVTHIEVVVSSKPIDKKKKEDKQKQSSLNVLRKLAHYKKYIQPRITKTDLDELSKFAMPKILSTLTYLGIVLKPEEFQKIALNKFNKPKLSDEFWKMGMHFGLNNFDSDPDISSEKLIRISPDHVTHEVVKVAEQYIDTRSFLQPILLRNILNTLEKVANKDIIIDEKHSSMEYLASPIMSLISGLYSKYASMVSNFSSDNINDAIAVIPELRETLINKAVDNDTVYTMDTIKVAMPGLDPGTAQVWLATSTSKVIGLDLETEVKNLEKLGVSKIFGNDKKGLLELDHHVTSLASVAGINHLMDYFDR